MFAGSDIWQLVRCRSTFLRWNRYRRTVVNGYVVMPNTGESVCRIKCNVRTCESARSMGKTDSEGFWWDRIYVDAIRFNRTPAVRFKLHMHIGTAVRKI